MLNFNKKKSSNYVPPEFEETSYVARVVQVIELGEQADDFNPEKDPRNVVMVTFEFPDVLNGDGNPAWLSRQYPVSNHEKAGLMALLKIIAPKALKGPSDTGWYEVSPSFDWGKDLLNKPVMASIGFTRSHKPKIVSIMAVPKGMPVGELKNEPIVFELDGNINADTVRKWNLLFPWVREMISKSTDQSTVDFAKAIEAAAESDTPF